MSRYQASKIIVIFLVLALATPAALAQLTIGDIASHKRLEITVNADGSAHVLHEIRSNASPVTMQSVEGNYENITMTDPDGNEVQHAISPHQSGFGVTVFQSRTNTIVEYDLIDAVTDVGGYKSWHYYYLETTTFTLPAEAENVYLNNGSLNLSDAKKIRCHGCEALIEYTSSENTFEYAIKSDNGEHRIGVDTIASVTSGGFDADLGAIRLEIDADEHAHLGINIPKMLLAEPYEAYYDSQRLAARITTQNDTHAYFELRMPESGTLDILGSGSDSSTITPSTTTTPPVTNQNNMPDIVIIGIAIAIAGAAGALVSVILWKRKKGQ